MLWYHHALIAPFDCCECSDERQEKERLKKPEGKAVRQRAGEVTYVVKQLRDRTVAISGVEFSSPGARHEFFGMRPNLPAMGHGARVLYPTEPAGYV